MCGGRSIRSDIAFVEIVICRRQNALKERLFACGKSELLFYFHFTGLLSQILLSCVIIAQLSDIRDKYIRYEEILRENMILWRKLINESAGIYEQGIILVKV